jgi:predicted nucleotidyltransferase
MRESVDKEKLVKLCEKNEIAFLGIFGSFVRGRPTADSDMDLLVRFSTRRSLLDLIRIEREFSETLGRSVDLVTEPSISPYLRDRIKAEVEVIYDQTR